MALTGSGYGVRCVRGTVSNQNQPSPSLSCLVSFAVLAMFFIDQNSSIQRASLKEVCVVSEDQSVCLILSKSFGITIFRAL